MPTPETLRRLRVALVLLAALIVVVVSVALSTPAIPERSANRIDVTRLRGLARSLPGRLPTRVNFAVIADSTKPMAGVLGGLRFDRYVMVWTAFQIVSPGASIVVDAPPDQAFHAARSAGDTYHAAAYQALQAALLRASAILVTHEHPDHLGGIARSPQLEQIRDRLRLTREQISSGRWLDAVAFPEDVRVRLTAIDYDACHALSPGVVLVKSPGHTPGSQMIYVQTEQGSELLLVGDIAWHRDHLERPAGRPRISSWIMNEDADAVADQIRALHDLARSEPVVPIPSHDRTLLQEHADAGRIHEGLE